MIKTQVLTENKHEVFLLRKGLKKKWKCFMTFAIKCPPPLIAFFSKHTKMSFKKKETSVPLFEVTNSFQVGWDRSGRKEVLPRKDIQVILLT